MPTRFPMYSQIVYRQHCAKRNLPVFNLLRGRFEVFHPAGATRCTDWGEIWHGGGDQRSPIGATVRVQEPQN